MSKLVIELAGRVPGLEPDADVIKTQVKVFKAASDKIVDGLSHEDENEIAGTDPMAKFLEEMKVLVRDLPSRITERLNETGGSERRRRFRRFHPMMLEEMMHMGVESGDPIGIVLAASMVRDDMPWFYEIAQEGYHAIKAGDVEAAERQIKRLHRMSEFFMRGPFMEEFGSKDMHMFIMEFPRMFEHMLRRCIEPKKLPSRPVPRRSSKAHTEA